MDEADTSSLRFYETMADVARGIVDGRPVGNGLSVAGVGMSPAERKSERARRVERATGVRQFVVVEKRRLRSGADGYAKKGLTGVAGVGSE